MTHLDSTSASDVCVRLPAGLLRLWHPGLGRGISASRGSRRSEPHPTEQLEELLTRTPGLHRLGPGLLAAVPLPGDGEIIDAAAAAGRRFLTEISRLQKSSDSERGEVRALVYPGQVELQGPTVRLLPTELDRLLDQKPPPLPTGTVHLTTRGGLSLETPLEIHAGPLLGGPSGEEIPSFRLGRREAKRPPWRNLEIWGRRTRWIPVTDLKTQFTDHSGALAVRVVGALGSGKTRAVMETRRFPEATVHVAVGSARAGTAPTSLRLLARCLGLVPHRETELETQVRELARELTAAGREAQASLETAVRVAGVIVRLAERRARDGSPPVTLVLDDLHRAGAAEWTLLSTLLAASPAGALKLFLVGRTGGWPGAPESLSALPLVEVPPWSMDLGQRLLHQLLPGIQLPELVEGDLLEASAGNPFALEEGVLGLIQQRLIRRFYGAFVYRGEADTSYRPSLRLTALLEAEGRRLGDPFPGRLLALAGETVPPREIASAAALAGCPTSPGWEKPFLEVGWLSHSDSPWGPAVAWSWGAAATAWRETVSPADRSKLRRTLGELLAEIGDAEGHWRAYRLLAGEPEAIPLLLRTAQPGGTSREVSPPADDLVEALRTELEHHRSRQGDPDTELRLLWRLMPLARQAGRLSELKEDLERALTLAVGDPRRIVALSLLKAELDHDEGHFRQAEQTLRTALQHSSSASEPQKAVLLVQLGHLLMRQERSADARKLFERILPSLENADLKSLAATCHFHLGNIALTENHLDDALEEHRKALAHRRQARAPKALSASLAALGAVSLAQGRYPQALAYYLEAEQVARETGDAGEISFALRGVGRSLSRLGDFTAATAPLRRALELREEGDDVMGRAVARLEVAENYLHLGNPAEALAEARKALFQLSLLGSSAALGDAERLLGRIQAQRRRPEEARRHQRTALEHHEGLGDALEAAFDRAELIRVALMPAELSAEGRSELIPLVQALSDFLEHHHYPELGDRLDLAMSQALEGLGSTIQGTRPYLFYLRRAYTTLMGKTAHLPSELRNRFLFQIPDHAAILIAASRHGLEIAAAPGSEPRAHPES